MNWDAISAVGEAIGAAAVVVSLFYLGLQIRHNSRHLQNAADDSISARYVATLSLVAQNPENAAVFHRGLTNPASLTDEQRAHFGYMIGLVLIQIGTTYDQHADGRVSAEQWRSVERSLDNYFSAPGVRAWWQKVGKTVFFDRTTSFAQYLDRLSTRHEQPS